MLRLSNTTLPPPAVSKNVTVRVPDVDRGCLYRLCTKAGYVNRLYARNEISAAEIDYITSADIPDQWYRLEASKVSYTVLVEGIVSKRSINAKNWCPLSPPNAKTIQRVRLSN